MEWLRFSALGVVICVAVGTAAYVGAGRVAPAPEEWEYGELGMRGSGMFENGGVWWEPGLNEAKTIRVSSIKLLAQKLGATTEVSHSTGLMNLLAAQGWEPVLSCGVNDFRIILRRKKAEAK